MSDTEDEPSSQDIIEEEVGDEMEVVDAKEAEGGENEVRKASGSESSEESDDEDEEYEVESILQSRFVKKKKQYLVKWVNYSDEWNTWEPMENLEGSQDLVQAYEKKEEEKIQKEESEKAAANERKRQAKAEREAKRREREAEKEAKRAKKEAEKPKSEAKPKVDSKRKSRAIISSSDSDDIAENEKKPTEKPKIEKNKTLTDAERRKKERKQDAKRKALKEKNEFRRLELEAERRKNMTNAYKNPGVGKDDIRAPTPEVPPEIQSERAEPEPKSTEEVTLRFLFGSDKESYGWQLPRVAEEFSRHKIVKVQKKVKCNVIDSMTASNIPPSDKAKLSHGETLIELTGTSSLLSNLVLSIVRDLASFRKSLPKYKQSDNKHLVLSVIIRNEFWETVFGKGNAEFQGFRKQCFSKLACGLDLPDSTERLVHIQGDDAGLAVSVRRIANKLGKAFGNNLENANADIYQPYLPRCYALSGDQRVYVHSKIESAPEESRLSILSTITSGSCEVALAHQDENDDHLDDLSLPPHPGYNFILTGKSSCISIMKYYLVEDGIMTKHSLSEIELGIVKDEKEKSDREKESDDLTVDSSCFYSMSNLACDKSVNIYGFVGEFDTAAISKHMAQFGAVEKVSRTEEEAFPVIVKFTESASALAALKKRDQVIKGIKILVIPFRFGDEKCSRVSRTVILENLPAMNESSLYTKFRENGVAMARIWPENPKIAFVIFSTLKIAKSTENMSPISMQPIFHDEEGTKRVDAHLLTSRIFKDQLFTAEQRLSIFEDFELIRIDTTDINRIQSIPWKEPIKLHSAKRPPDSSSIPRRAKKPRPPSESLSIETSPIKPPVKRPPIAPKSIAPPSNDSVNLLATVMTTQIVETNKQLIDARNNKLKVYKSSVEWSYFVANADAKTQADMIPPDPQKKYELNRIFFQRAFEWKHNIDEWVKNDKQRKMRTRTPEPDLNDFEEPMDGPWDPATAEPLNDSIESSLGPPSSGILCTDEPQNLAEVHEFEMMDTIEDDPFLEPPSIGSSGGWNLGSGSSRSRKNSNKTKPSPQPVGQFMPQRGRRGKRGKPDDATPRLNLTSAQLDNVNIGSNLAATLKALGQNRNILDNLRNQPIEEEEPEMNPIASLSANPPQEIRKILRNLKLGKSDLDLLLNIPLKVMTEHNVYALIDEKHHDREHVNKKDPAKLISLIRMYLTPPDDAQDINKKTPEKDSPKTPDKDEIYKCVEFREILESSLKLLKRGKAIMTEIYDMNSIELEPGADF